MTPKSPQKQLFSDKDADPKKRTFVYVDGFNLYHGAVKGTDCKWLDLQEYFEKLRPAEDVVKIHYFTARVNGSAWTRQERFLLALNTLAKVRVTEGRYKTKTVRCHVQECTHPTQRKFTTWEEKRTDVNIAVQMMDDAYQELCEVMVVVSGDSDLVPPLLRIKERFPDMKLVVYVPARNAQRGAAVEIRSAADKHATLPIDLLKRCQLPTKVPDGAGGYIEKPESW